VNTANESMRSKLNKQIKKFLSEGGEITEVSSRKTGVTRSPKKLGEIKTVAKRPLDNSADH
jgi:hypothetical protein